eukprot:GHVR01163685.1.p1 GENE.GHVR01163685.1~~GHVR01163685.1.p1  ORF type:complete len:367 (-),score=29.00 GHVR01163685.1:720-1820(-)
MSLSTHLFHRVEETTRLLHNTNVDLLDHPNDLALLIDRDRFENQLERAEANLANHLRPPIPTSPQPEPVSPVVGPSPVHPSAPTHPTHTSPTPITHPPLLPTPTPKAITPVLPPHHPVAVPTQQSTTRHKAPPPRRSPAISVPPSDPAPSSSFSTSRPSIHTTRQSSSDTPVLPPVSGGDRHSIIHDDTPPDLPPPSESRLTHHQISPPLAVPPTPKRPRTRVAPAATRLVAPLGCKARLNKVTNEWTIEVADEESAARPTLPHPTIHIAFTSAPQWTYHLQASGSDDPPTLSISNDNTLLSAPVPLQSAQRRCAEIENSQDSERSTEFLTLQASTDALTWVSNLFYNRSLQEFDRENQILLYQQS